MSYFHQIRDWAHNRNLVHGSTPTHQMLKLTEEMGELAKSIAKGKNKAADDIGDMVVVLTILAAQMGMHIEDCIAVAWEEIKDRKGRMIDGIFVKEADL